MRVFPHSDNDSNSDSDVANIAMPIYSIKHRYVETDLAIAMPLSLSLYGNGALESHMLR